MCGEMEDRARIEHSSLYNVFTSQLTHSAIESLLPVLPRTIPVMKPVPTGCAAHLLASSEQSDEPIVLGPNVLSDLLRAAY